MNEKLDHTHSLTFVKKSSDRDYLLSRIRSIFFEQKFAVLSTTSSDGWPYGNIVAFTSSDDLKRMYFTTSKKTQKYLNIISEPRVSLLVSNRGNESSDFQVALSITSMGKAHEVMGNGVHQARRMFLVKHPELAEFVNDTDCALIQIEIIRYIFVSDFQKVQVLELQGTDRL